jgi:hypothetical protein
MTEEVVNNEEQGVAEPTLSLNDIVGAARIIDICAKRGAFEGSELEAVGQVRRRLVEFVKSHSPETEEGEEADNVVDTEAN